MTTTEGYRRSDPFELTVRALTLYVIHDSGVYARRSVRQFPYAHGCALADGVYWLRGNRRTTRRVKKKGLCAFFRGGRLSNDKARKESHRQDSVHHLLHL